MDAKRIAELKARLLASETGVEDACAVAKVHGGEKARTQMANWLLHDGKPPADAILRLLPVELKIFESLS